jgi:excisionase family DNA binding protein
VKSPVLRGEQAIEPVLLSISASADFLGLSRDTIYRLLGTGKLTAVKHGSKTLLPIAGLRDYAASLPEARIKPPNRIGAETPKPAA